MSFGNVPYDIKLLISSKSKKIEPINQTYNLVITGNIGVGKSTICELIKSILTRENIQFNIYPEYITFNKTGQMLLDMKMKGHVSTFTFQNYILDVWKTIIKQNSNHQENVINIFERLPYDAMYCFAAEEYKRGNISPDEYSLLIKNYNSLDCFDYGACQKCTIKNDDLFQTIDDVIDVINSDQKNKITHRSITLTADNINERILMRGRECEKQYSDELLNEYSKFYDE